MRFLPDFFGGGWDLGRVAPPWGDRPSIHAHILAHVRPGVPGLAEGGDKLPDEDVVYEDNRLRWAPGALDGTFGHHGAGAPAEEIAQEMLEALCALTRRPTDEAAAELYRLLTTHRALEYVDTLLEQVVSDDDLDPERLHAVGRWLAEDAADREAVKLGISLLGIVQGGDDRELLLTLGRHDELTLYSVVALLRTDAPERALLELGRNVDGWGRVSVVERLAEARDEQVRAWLLREGYRNSVMYEYTVFPAAVGGDLVGALRLPDPDPALLRGAGEILETLILGRDGPAATIADYADGAEAAELFLRHLQTRDLTLEEVRAVQVIRDFVHEDEGTAIDPDLGWPARRETISALADAILSRPAWGPRVRAGLASTDPTEFRHAAQAAKGFGIDPWDAYHARIEAGRGEAWDWWHLMHGQPPERMERVIALAERVLPLDEIAAGPTGALGMGSDYAPQSALDFVLQDLDAVPGRGWALIRAGLQSATQRNRNMACHALSAWKRADWPAEAEPILRRAIAREPVEQTRDWLQRVLDGRPLHDPPEPSDEDDGSAEEDTDRG